MKRSHGQVLRLLRRSVALALALCAGWVTLRTADLPQAGSALQALGQDATLAVSLLRSQLHVTQADASLLSPWQRLVLAQSPQLQGAQAAVLGQEDSPSVSAPAADTPASQVFPEDPDEEEDAPAPDSSTPDNIIAKTLQPSSSQSYLQAGGIYIANRANKDVDAAALADAELNISLDPYQPQVLILHSHATEAYTPAGNDVYEESDPYRTTDCSYNLVRVGEEIAQVMRQAGLNVIHDTNLYDYPSYNQAYSNSLQAVQQWLKQYPSIQIVLDVHRDALVNDNGTIFKVVSQEGDEQAAQVMLVVGSDGKGDSHPLWQENLAFAMDLQQQMLDDWNTLARPMVLRSSRFNQHLAVGSVLVEIGTHGNTLEEALAGARLFARSASAVIRDLVK